MILNVENQPLAHAGLPAATKFGSCVPDRGFQYLQLKTDIEKDRAACSIEGRTAGAGTG